MAIFNSLGSNYSWSFVRRSLFGRAPPAARRTFEAWLVHSYGGHVTLTYKGRDALRLALEMSDLAAGSAVGINAFTCYVVYQAVENAGFKPVFIDVSPDQLNFAVSELEQAHRQAPKLAAIIVQNTLGYPADMTALNSYCVKHDLLIIEDLAHSMGATYQGGQEAGTVGAFTMLSFSQDKPLDVVAGGALIDRRPGVTATTFKAPLVSNWQRLKNPCYPFWSGLIRGLYDSGAGRILHAVLKRLRWLATPMSDNITGPHSMSAGVPGLLLERLNGFEDELAHRRAIAAIYQAELPPSLPAATNNYGHPTFLRFPILCANRPSLIAHLRHHHIYAGDTWYDAPIAPKRYLAKTCYQAGQCPRAEQLAEQIVNLPTHRYVTPEIARSICATIRRWQA